MKDKIIEMLGSGLSQSVVAKACGVTDGYISQLMSDEGIRAQVTEAKIVDIEKNLRADKLIEAIELRSLEKLEQSLAFASKPRDILAIFQVMNSAKKKTQEISGTGQGPTAPIVQITISTAAAIQFRMDSAKQVVEIDGRSMTTLPAKQLNKALAERQNARPLITDASSASSLLDQVEAGIPEHEF